MLGGGQLRDQASAALSQLASEKWRRSEFGAASKVEDDTSVARTQLGDGGSRKVFADGVCNDVPIPIMRFGDCRLYQLIPVGVQHRSFRAVHERVGGSERKRSRGFTSASKKAAPLFALELPVDLFRRAGSLCPRLEPEQARRPGGKKRKVVQRPARQMAYPRSLAFPATFSNARTTSIRSCCVTPARHTLVTMSSFSHMRSATGHIPRS